MTGRPKRPSYTLIEISIVLTLIALLAGGAAISLRGPVQRARFEQGSRQIEFLDQNLRAACRNNHEGAWLDIDTSENALRTSHGFQGETAGRTLELGSECQIRRIRLPGKAWSSDFVRLAVSPQGETATYGLELERSGQGADAWLLFAGITGQIIHCDSEEEVDAYFQILETTWTDAD